MGSALDHAAVVEEEDLVGVPHRGEIVRDQDHDAAGAQLAQRFANQPAVLLVQARRGLVEDQDRRRAHHGAGDGDALALPVRQQLAALADHRVVAARKGGDEIVGARDARRRHDLLLGHARGAVSDVVAHTDLKQHVLLGHHRDRPAQRLDAVLADVAVVDQDRAPLGVPQAQQEVHDRRLAGARGAGERQELPAADPEGDLAERRPPRLVGERDVGEAHALDRPRQRHGVGAIADLGCRVEDFENPLGRGGGLRDAARCSGPCRAAGRKALLRYERKTMRSPGVRTPRVTLRAPNQSTRAVPTEMRMSEIPTSFADSRCAFTPSPMSSRLRAVKVSRCTSSSDIACTTLIEPMTSAAAALTSPPRLRCWRATRRILVPRLRVASTRRGMIARAAAESRQSIQVMTASMPRSVTPWARSGRTAVIATSLTRPMSAVTRVIRSPARLRWWKESDSRCRCEKSSARVLLSTLLPASEKPTRRR